MAQLMQRLALPSPKGVALTLMQACRRDDVSVGEITELVKADPALSARLIQLANGAQQAGRPVVSLEDCVTRLGMNTVKNVALAFSLLDQHREGACTAFDYARYWRLSLWMALAMQALTARTRTGAPSEMFSCGLLARIGQLALATAHPQEYQLLLESGVQGPQLLLREQETLHTDHLSLSVELMRDWGFPAPLIEPIRHMEGSGIADADYDSRAQRLIDLVRLSYMVSEFCELSPAQRRHRMSDLKLHASLLGLDIHELSEVVEAMTLSAHGIAPLLKISLEPLPNLESIEAPAPMPEPTAENRSRQKVLVVEDDPTVQSVLTHWLGEVSGYDVQVAVNGHDALDMALAFKPHIIITDWRMPVMDGLEFCRTLRATEWGQNIYVLMLTSVGSEDEFVQAFEVGVDDFVNKPVNVRALDARLKAAWRYVHLREAWLKDQERLLVAMSELAITNRKLERNALTDELTDLPNRRAGMGALTQAWSTAHRAGQALSVISLDIDHFKSINDRMGHAVGDVVLKWVAKALREASRQEDTVVRWGGEEFLVILNRLGLLEGIRAAERLRKAIEVLQLPMDHQTLRVTVSLGVAATGSSIGNMEQLLKAADDALYAAKRGGRNRVAMAGPDGPRLVASSR